MANTINMTYMLRITGLSLLLGALALIAGLALFFSPPSTTESQAPAMNLSSPNTRVSGTATRAPGELELELDAQGRGVIALAEPQIDASAFPFLHLAIEDSSHLQKVWIFWNTGENARDVRTYVPHNKSWSSLWLATQELQGWSDYIGFVSLVIVGKPGETIRITDFGIYPTSPLRQLQAIYSDLAGYVPWSRAAMNSNTGVTPVSSFYPTILSVAFLTLSLLAYGLLLLVFRFRVKFSWQAVALIFLVCWIGLDLFWQKRLLHQVVDTYRTFSGKNTQEKLNAGPDATLYNFIEHVIPLVQPTDTRIFMSTSDTFLGQRGAYYLYPFNVYWPGPSGEFPPDYFLHSGDLIVLINPTPMRFNAAANKLATSPNTQVGAELIFSDRIGQVVRLK